jgi:P27 family predicted phage terminase small subunit
MRPGRKPKPFELKLIEGNRGKRPIKKEPKPEALASLSAPSWLDALGREFWKRHAHELARLGLLTILDHDLLSAAAERWSVYRRAARELKTSLVQLTEANGRIGKPESAIAKQALMECRAILAEFGCSPASRTRVGANIPENETKDPAAKYFDGG